MLDNNYHTYGGNNMKKIKNGKKVVKEASVLLIAVVLILTSVAAMANTIRTSPVLTGRDTILDEGFEDGVMPPSGGWYTDELNLVTPWTIVDAVTYPDFVHSGDYAAWINYDTPNPSDNWLVSPDLDLTGYDSVTLVFWAESNINWPTATMELHIRGDGFDDTIWDMVQDEVWSDFIYREMTFDLSSYIGQVIDISWRYVGIDGNSFGLDDITVTTSGEELVASANGPYEGVVGEDISFTGSATGGTSPYIFEWDFGDGSSSEEQNPVHSYAEAGVYDVTLTVIDAELVKDVDTTTATISEDGGEPELAIGEVTGGLAKIDVEIKNIGDADASDVDWEISVSGGFLKRIDKNESGSISNLNASSAEVISIVPIVGLGRISINVTASADGLETVSKEVEGFVFFFIVRIL